MGPTSHTVPSHSSPRTPPPPPPLPRLWKNEGRAGAQTNPAAPPNIPTPGTTRSLGAQQAIFALLTLAPTRARPRGRAERAGHGKRADWPQRGGGRRKRGRLGEREAQTKGVRESGGEAKVQKKGASELMRIQEAGIMRSPAPPLIRVHILGICIYLDSEFQSQRALLAKDSMKHRNNEESRFFFPFNNEAASSVDCI